MVWRGGAGNEMKKRSEQKGIQPGECGRIRDKSCGSWGCATEATERWFPFLLVQSVLPEEMDGPRFLATPSQYSCNKLISGAWEKPCKHFGKLRRQHLLPALPTDALGNFTGPIRALWFWWAFPSHSSSQPGSFTLLPAWAPTPFFVILDFRVCCCERHCTDPLH